MYWEKELILRSYLRLKEKNDIFLMPDWRFFSWTIYFAEVCVRRGPAWAGVLREHFVPAKRFGSGQLQRGRTAADNGAHAGRNLHLHAHSLSARVPGR